LALIDDIIATLDANQHQNLTTQAQSQRFLDTDAEALERAFKK
jgi:hypothetical protein